MPSMPPPHPNLQSLAMFHACTSNHRQGVKDLKIATYGGQACFRASRVEGVIGLGMVIAFKAVRIGS